MNRTAYVYVDGIQAGILKEIEGGFSFSYLEEYLGRDEAKPVSLTLPLDKKGYVAETLFSFFDSILPEGWLRDRYIETLHLDPKDKMGLLLASCKDAPGNVSVEEIVDG